MRECTTTMSQPGEEPSDGPEERGDNAASPPPSTAEDRALPIPREEPATGDEPPLSESLSRVFYEHTANDPDWMSESTRQALNEALAAQMPNFASLVSAPLRETLNQLIAAQMPNFASLVTAPVRETVNQVIAAQMPNFASLV